MTRSLPFIFLFVFVLAACGRSSAQVDQKLYGPWSFHNLAYQENGALKTGTVDGDIVISQDNKCRGMRIIGKTSGSLDGPITVSGDKLTFSAESDVTYTWTIREAETNGKPVWDLALVTGTMTYHLFRDRK